MHIQRIISEISYTKKVEIDPMGQLTRGVTHYGLGLMSWLDVSLFLGIPFVGFEFHDALGLHRYCRSSVGLGT